MFYGSQLQHWILRFGKKELFVKTFVKVGQTDKIIPNQDIELRLYCKYLTLSILSKEDYDQ